MLKITSSMLFCVLCVVLFPAFQNNQVDVNQDQDESKQAQQDDDKIPVPDEDSIARRDFMRTKLLYSQNIFEGLTTRDFTLVLKGANAVEKITEGEKWVTINNPAYQKLTEEFNTSVKRLKDSANKGNIEATALRFYEMSTRCIDCHQHLRTMKYDF